jgi:hypothetical protein
VRYTLLIGVEGLNIHESREVGSVLWCRDLATAAAPV